MDLRRLTPFTFLSLALTGAACIPLKGDLGDFTATAEDDTDGESGTSAGLTTSGTSSTSTTGPNETSSTGPAQTGTSSTSTTGPDTSGTSSTSTTSGTEGSSTSTGPGTSGTEGSSTGTSTTGPDTSSSGTEGTSSTSTGPGTSSTSTTGGVSDPYPICAEPGDPFTIVGASVVGDTLHLDVQYAGGCEAHAFSLCFGGIVLDLGWVELAAVHDAHDDLCKALISAPRTFDLSPLKQFPSPVTIVLDGWAQKLIYVH